MPWIESHQSLKEHPKLILLAVAMGWDEHMTIGRLHRFWWWCLDYAIDGNLTKFNDAQIAHGMGVAVPHSKQLVSAMVESRWIDREPYMRVHDWWVYVGRFLKVKWKDQPEKWKAVQAAYTGTVTDAVTDTVTRTTNLSNQPTEPDLPNQPTDPGAEGLPVELPAGFPSLEMAKRHAAIIGCPEQFAEDTWNKAVSRGGRDARDIPIRAFRNHLAIEYKYERERIAKQASGHVGKTFAPSIAQQIAATKDLLSAVEKKLKAIVVPSGPLYADERERKLKERAPLITERAQLQDKLNELQRKQLETV